MRSENEAISKYTAAEILRNKRPRESFGIVPHRDPAATVSCLVGLGVKENLFYLSVDCNIFGRIKQKVLKLIISAVLEPSSCGGTVVATIRTEAQIRAYCAGNVLFFAC